MTRSDGGHRDIWHDAALRDVGGGEQTKGRDRDGRKACRLPAQNIAMKRVANHRIAARGHASKHCDKRLGASFAEQVLRNAGAVLQVCIVDQM